MRGWPLLPFGNGHHIRQAEAIAGKIVDAKADYLLALKDNQGTLCGDVAEFFADPPLAADCLCARRTDSGHGRIEERVCLVADASGWLAERHPQWQALRSIAQVIPATAS